MMNTRTMDNLIAIVTAGLVMVGLGVLPNLLATETLPKQTLDTQTMQAMALDSAGDRDGVGEFQDGLPESSPNWDCATMGNLECQPTPVADVLAEHGVGR